MYITYPQKSPKLIFIQWKLHKRNLTQIIASDEIIC